MLLIDAEREGGVVGRGLMVLIDCKEWSKLVQSECPLSLNYQVSGPVIKASWRPL